MAICEGVIDALSIWQLYQIPTIATLGTSNFYTLQLPSRISKVYIYADNDSAGIMAANALHTRLVSTGIYSDIRLPPENMKDMNEYLMTIPESVEVDLFGEC